MYAVMAQTLSDLTTYYNNLFSAYELTVCKHSVYDLTVYDLDVYTCMSVFTPNVSDFH